MFQSQLHIRLPYTLILHSSSVRYLIHIQAFTVKVWEQQPFCQPHLSSLNIFPPFLSKWLPTFLIKISLKLPFPDYHLHLKVYKLYLSLAHIVIWIHSSQFAHKQTSFNTPSLHPQVSKLFFWWNWIHLIEQ